MLKQFRYYWVIWKPALAKHPRIWTLIFATTGFAFVAAFNFVTAPATSAPTPAPASYSQQTPVGSQTASTNQTATVASSAPKATQPPPVPLPALHDKSINSFRNPATDIELPELPEIIR